MIESLAALASVGMAIGSAVSNLINASKENSLKNEATQYNKEWSLQNAKLALQESAEDERRFRVQSRQQLGGMIANYGASGVTMEGSPLEVLAQSAANAELDALTIRHQGAVKAWSFENQAKISEFEGYASNELLPGRIAGSLLGAGSTVLGNFALKRT